MICAGVSFYQCVKELVHTLDSLVEFDKVFCVDGAWEGYAKPELSDDGSRKLVQSYDNTILIDAPNYPEWKKRNLYMEESEGCDALLVIDSDESILDMRPAILDIKKEFGKPPNMVNIPVYQHSKNWHIQWLPRLIIDPYHVRYNRRHDRFIMTFPDTLAPRKTAHSHDIILFEDKYTRSTELQAKRSTYYSLNSSR
jgi:hypothetical protein